MVTIKNIRFSFAQKKREYCMAKLFAALEESKVKVRTFLTILLFGLAVPMMSFANEEEGMETQKVAKQISCKQQAKKAGLKSRKERKAFVKSCEAKKKEKKS